MDDNSSATTGCLVNLDFRPKLQFERLFQSGNLVALGASLRPCSDTDTTIFFGFFKSDLVCDTPFGFAVRGELRP